MLSRLGLELRHARLAAGLTLRQVARALGISPVEASRIERGLAPWVSLTTLSRYAAAVGLDLWTRFYPGGEPIRDVAHLAVLDGLVALLGPGIDLRTEVLIGEARDQRAWDAVVTDRAGKRAAVELETRIVDVQAMLRRIALKRRDGGIETVILVIADTRANRSAAWAARTAIAADYPLDETAIRASLIAGRVPPASGLLFVPTRQSTRPDRG